MVSFVLQRWINNQRRLTIGNTKNEIRKKKVSGYNLFCSNLNAQGNNILYIIRHDVVVKYLRT